MGKIRTFSERDVIFVNYAKKTHVFRKGTPFLRIMRKNARFPRVEFVDFRKIATAPRENQKIDSGVMQNQYQIKAKSPPHREKIRT